MRMVLFMQFKITLKKAVTSEAPLLDKRLDVLKVSHHYYSPGTHGRISIPGSVKKMSRCDAVEWAWCYRKAGLDDLGPLFQPS